MKNPVIIKKNSDRQNNAAEKNWRIYVLSVFIFLIALSIIGKLFILQVSRHDSFVALADNQHRSTTELEAKRGEIFLQDEGKPYPIAVNKEMQMAYAVPKEIKDVGAVVDLLAPILSMDQEVLNQKLGNPDDMFEILKHKLSDDEASKVRDLKISGIYLQGENFRYYPSGELASQLIGFVGSNGLEQKGMYGIESFWNNKLKGEVGSINQEGDSRGRWIPVADRDMQSAKDGPDIILTINHTVQFEIEKILKESLDSFNASGASIIVMEPKTGKILAMANGPSFNLNDFSKTEDISTFANPAISEQYESGSVFKPFTVAIGMDSGKINPSSTYTDTGTVNEAGYEIHNSDLKANGVQTMTEVLEKSLNTGVIYIEKLVGNKTFRDYIDKFGFGSKTGIELPGELSGNTKNLSNFNSNINFFTASFGQGISVTPLQLALGYSALANGGTLMKPQIVDKFIFSDGHEEKIKPQEIRQVISQNTSAQIGQMLRLVVTNGHGKRADVPGYLVCGKTGTAQVAKIGGGGYEEGINVGSFAGFAPLNDPQFVVIVKIINPRGVEWAESSAAPTFGQVMKFLLEYYKVKPTEDTSTSPLAKMAPMPWPLVIPGNQAAISAKNQDVKNKSIEKTSSKSKIIKSAD